MLPMPRQFDDKERDPDLGDKLRPEHPYILRAALKRLPILLERKRFDLPQACVNMYQSYKMKNDSVLAWVTEEEKRGGKEDFCKRTEAKDEYATYCRNSGFRAVSAGKLYDRLEAMGFDLLKRNGFVGYKGMKAAMFQIVSHPDPNF